MMCLVVCGVHVGHLVVINSVVTVDSFGLWWFCGLGWTCAALAYDCSVCFTWFLAGGVLVGLVCWVYVLFVLWLFGLVGWWCGV